MMTPAMVARMVRVGELAGSRGRGGVVGERFGEAEVEDFEAAVGGDFDVGGLEVAMDDAFFVGVFERVDELLDEGEGFVAAGAVRRVSRRLRRVP